MRNYEVWISKVIPGLIVFGLWLDGWFFPLILLPIFYVLLVEKKSLEWLGFSRHGLRYSIIMGLLILLVLSGVYYPIFLHYPGYVSKQGTIDIYVILLDLVWYPLYEEITYRSFALTHFAELDKSSLSTKNLIANISQSFLFVSIHKQHFGAPPLLVLVFLLGFLNGFLFLKTRNAYGCIVSHSTLNGFALLLRFVQSIT
ncbi:MAG: type II CAAX prenyl endopeptidase Rce1 family protein [Candidatus Bathyarchaeia archaeon]